MKTTTAEIADIYFIQQSLDHPTRLPKTITIPCYDARVALVVRNILIGFDYYYKPSIFRGKYLIDNPLNKSHAKGWTPITQLQTLTFNHWSKEVCVEILKVVGLKCSSSDFLSYDVISEKQLMDEEF